MKMPKLFGRESSDTKADPVQQPQSVELVETVLVGKTKEGKVVWQTRGISPLDALKYVSILERLMLEEVFKSDHKD